MKNDLLREDIYREYKKHLGNLNQLEMLEGWKKMKYEKRCYPYTKLVGDMIKI